jgi:hypothetical protein
METNRENLRELVSRFDALQRIFWLNATKEVFQARVWGWRMLVEIFG